MVALTFCTSEMGEISSTAEAAGWIGGRASLTDDLGSGRLNNLLRLARFNDRCTIFCSLKSDFRFRGFDLFLSMFRLSTLSLK